MRNCAIFFLLLLPMLQVSAQQQTVGLMTVQADSWDGYTLMAPLAYFKTYLLDPCGREVHTWESAYRPGNSAYLLEDGNLLRTARLAATNFSGGGRGGRVERFDWDGNLIWEFDYESTTYMQHHDIEYLPNGNVLILSWDKYYPQECIDQGRDPAMITGGEIWSEKVVEVRPILPDSAEIVWEWRAWDHLVQDFDSTKQNYGIVADHPERLDINFLGGYSPVADWLHCNGVSYNPVLDQIVLSCRNFSEFWVIDHSTTTAEAAGSTGGNSGKGGDILYRWGNPQAYDRGDTSDQVLWAQHDAHFIPEGLPGAGQIMVFNNGSRRPNPFSRVEVLEPPMDSLGNYSLAPGQPYGPVAPSWFYQAPNPQDFYSHFISGAQRLPNGNTLICAGADGQIFEVDSTGNILWDYINPVASSGPILQGGNPAGNTVFRSYRYGSGYPGLQGRDLSPGDPLEINPLPLPAACAAVGSPEPIATQLSIGPNPFGNVLRCELSTGRTLPILVRDMTGRTIWQGILRAGNNQISTESWPAGMYFVSVADDHMNTIKVLKQ